MDKLAKALKQLVAQASGRKARCQKEAVLMDMRDFLMGLGERSARTQDHLDELYNLMAKKCAEFGTDDGLYALNKELESHRRACNPMD